MKQPCQTAPAPGMGRFSRAALAIVALFLFASAAFAYVVKLKDGSLVFARTPYTVKGKRAIITLENGTVTQIDLDKIDVPGTDKYNRENFGNVVSIDAPEEKPKQLPTPIPRSSRPLADLVRPRQTSLGLPTPGPATSAGSGAAAEARGPVDPGVQAAFSRIFEETSIARYRMTNDRGKTRLSATVNSEQEVFNVLAASARAITEAASRGRAATVEIVLTTASGGAAGTFEMTPEQAKLLATRATTLQDYFVKNVIF
ncbi:MAG: hypothetical protein M3542_07740 [Acidobacteriota bacterium]|nr:hypothetical protein [Acidobacteriota bacterium]